MIAPSGQTLTQATQAWQALAASGWTEAALRAGSLSVGFDLWRAVAAGYASAYTRSPAEAMPAGYRYAVRDAQGAAPAPHPAEAALFDEPGFERRRPGYR